MRATTATSGLIPASDLTSRDAVEDGVGATPRRRDAVDASDRREDDEGEESDDDSLAGQAVVTVRTAMMNVKRASIVALGNLAEYTEGLICAAS